MGCGQAARREPPEGRLRPRPGRRGAPPPRGQVVRGPLQPGPGAAVGDRPARGSPGPPKVPLRSEGAAGGPTGGAGAGPGAGRPAPADAARAQWPPARHSLFTMVAAQSARPRRPLPP